MIIIISVLLLLVPGLISVRIKWHKKNITKSDISRIICDYLIFSFLILFITFAFIFFADTIRGLRFSDRVFAFRQGVSAGFILNYSAVAIIAAVVLPLRTFLFSQIRMLIRKENPYLKAIIKKYSRAKIAVFVISVLLVVTIAATMIYTTSYAPQILAISSNEVHQARYLPDGQEYEGNAEIIIAGMNLSPATAVYANGLRVNNVREITRYAEGLEHVFDTALQGFESGLGFYIPAMLLETDSIVDIIAVNNADAFIPARSNTVSVHVLETKFPEIISITATHIINSTRVQLHIYGNNFSPYATVSINGQWQTAAAVHDEQNIYVMLDTFLFPFVFADEDDEYVNEEWHEDEHPEGLPERLAPDEISVVVYNIGGIQSIEYIVSGITGIDATTTITHADTWMSVGNGVVASGLGGWNDLAGTNSREAFLHNYRQGFRLFEMNTQFSFDGILFGIRESHRTPGLTFDQEQEQALYTLMPFEEIATLMVTYNDWQLIIDPQYQNNLHAIVRTIEYIISTINRIDPDLIDRIIIQVPYQHWYYFLVSNFPFSAYIYNLHSSDDVDTDTQALEFIERTRIPAVRMSIDRATPEFLEALRNLDVSVFFNAANELHQTRTLFNLGIAGVFTDFFTPAMRNMSVEWLQSRDNEALTLQNHMEFISFVRGLPTEPDDNHIRFISADSVNTDDMPYSVLDAFLSLTNLSSAPVDEFFVNGNLVIDDFHYNVRIDSGVITYIVYDKNRSQLIQWAAFDPSADYKRINLDISRENNRRYLLGYLDSLQYENLIVLVSVKDEASADLDASILEKLSELGLTQSLEGREAYSYAAIINGRTVVYENLSDERVEQAQFVDGWLIEIISEGRLQGNDISRILIDGVDYSRHRRGINIAVLNKQTGLIEDWVVFDTHYGLSANRG